MALQIVDAMNNAGAWNALAPNGATPSTEISAADETNQIRYGADAHSLRVAASGNAQDHLLRRTRAALDLSAFGELRLWIFSSRIADGSASQPFFLELRLGSAALALDAPGNTWHRYLPVARAGTWELLRLSLADLAPAVRSSLSALQLRCIDAALPFTCVLDDLAAVRDEMLADADAALLARLHERITINGTAVPALLYVPGVTAPSQPYIRITQHHIAFADERTSSSRARTDFSSNRFALRPPSYGYNLHYQFEAVAANRSEQAAILEFILRELTPRGELIVNNSPLPLEWMPVPPYNADGAPLTDRALLHFRVLTYQEVGAAEPAVPPYHSVSIEIDQAQPA